MEDETVATVQNGTAANGRHDSLADEAVAPRPTPERPAVRYMDDATFQRCLEKVVNVHDRLLAELAK